MDKRDWNEILDRYLSENRISSSDYEKCDREQKNIIQEIKKAIKRLKTKIL